jgi:hypothetical protein
MILNEFSPSHKMEGKDLVRIFEPAGIVSRWYLQQKTGTVRICFNILKIGQAAFCSVPFELFVEYGLRIRARSKAEQVFIIQLANGSAGYLPTAAAVSGGSYSSKPASTLVGPQSGDILTETLIQEINQIFDYKERNILFQGDIK